MAEIEHYVDPDDKNHERFREVRDVVLTLLDRHTQTAGSTKVLKMGVGEAVERGIIANETLGYFITRIYQFLLKIGINPERLRFRQHMSNEMAHYATDCWDAEIENSTGWTECVGCADRAAYDLTVHSARTGHPLVVRQALKEPVVIEKEVPEFNKKSLGKTFKQSAGVVQQTVEAMEEPALLALKQELAQGCVVLLCLDDLSLTSHRSASIKSSDGNEFNITPELLTIERKTFKQSSTFLQGCNVYTCLISFPQSANSLRMS
jgi:glycyl-tRNA synthetase